MNRKNGFLVFHISYICEADCIFCSEFNRLNSFKGRFINLKSIVKILRKKFGEGFRQVHFTGGEPFLHPNISKILKISKKIGFDNYILTNGRYLSIEKNFITDMENIDGLDISVHGYNRKSCYKMTNNDNNYKYLLKLFRLLKYNKEIIKNKDIFTNTVLTDRNIDDLKYIYNFINNYFEPSFFLLSYLAPEGKGVQNYNKRRVGFKKFNNIIKKVFVNEKNELIKDVRLAGIPICEIKNDKLKSKSNDLYYSPRETVEIDRIDGNNKKLRVILSKKAIRNRKYLDKCKGCNYRKRCGGYPSLYKK